MERVRVFIRIAGYFIALVAFLAAVAVTGVFFGSQRVLAARPMTTVGTFSSAGGSIAHGKHIASSYGSCISCHGADLGGAPMYVGDPAMGTLAASNLTRGAGGIGSTYSDGDFERAIRHGIRPDGTGLFLMPSVAYSHMSDADLSDLVAYIRSVPPVDRTTPARSFGPLARALLAAGKLQLQPDKIDPNLVAPATTPTGVSLERGDYLVKTSGCMQCHGANLAGGHYEGSPSDPAATNITPAGIGTWTEADFAHTMRSGTDPSGHQLSRFMPWPTFGQMDDDELAAIWTYLRTVPPSTVQGGG
jgi:mono/diheme cytochrome c family protein